MTGRWRFDCTQDVDGYVYPLRKVNDKEKDVGKEVDACTQTLEAFGNRVDNEAAGVEFA